MGVPFISVAEVTLTADEEASEGVDIAVEVSSEEAEVNGVGEVDPNQEVAAQSGERFFQTEAGQHVGDGSIRIRIDPDHTGEVIWGEHHFVL